MKGLVFVLFFFGIIRTKGREVVDLRINLSVTTNTSCKDKGLPTFC